MNEVDLSDQLPPFREPYPLESMPPCPECGGRLAVLDGAGPFPTYSHAVYNDLSTLHCLLKHPNRAQARWERQYGAVPVNEGLVAHMYERLQGAGVPRLTAMQAATNLIMADEASE